MNKETHQLIDNHGQSIENAIVKCRKDSKSVIEKPVSNTKPQNAEVFPSTESIQPVEEDLDQILFVKTLKNL